jgi:hypothetical protein
MSCVLISSLFVFLLKSDIMLEKTGHVIVNVEASPSYMAGMPFFLSI